MKLSAQLANIAESLAVMAIGLLIATSACWVIVAALNHFDR